MGNKLALAVKLIKSTEVTYHINLLVSVQNQLLEFTVHCSIFIQDYLHRPRIGRTGFRKDRRSWEKEKRYLSRLTKGLTKLMKMSLWYSKQIIRYI